MAWNWIKETSANVAYKGAGLVLNTGLAQAAARWALKPTVEGKIAEGKKEFKTSLVKAKSKMIKDEDGLLKKVPAFKKLANEIIDQLDNIAEDLTVDANINLLINILCNHFGDFNDINKIGEEIDKLLKDDVEALAQKFVADLTDPKDGIVNIKLFKEINADFDKVSSIGTLSANEQKDITKLVKDGLLMKKIQKMRNAFTEEKIEEVIERAKEFLNEIFDKLKLTVEEKSSLDDVIDNILITHLDEMKAKIDRLLKIAPKILEHILEDSLKKKPVTRTVHVVKDEDADEDQDDEFVHALELSKAETAKRQTAPKKRGREEDETPKKKSPSKKRAAVESDDEDLALALELSAKEHQTAITHAKKKFAPIVRSKSKAVEKSEHVVIDLDAEEEVSIKEEKKPVIKKKGPGRK